MKKSEIKNIFNEESGYALVENLIVMPVVFIILFALIFAGCMLHAKCTIESAARRGVTYATKLVCDPQYDKITSEAINEKNGELNELAEEKFDFSRIEHYQPYRYLPLLADSNLNNVEMRTKDYVRRIIDQSVTWMFTIDTDSIECSASNYVIGQSIRVKIKATYYTPKVFWYLGIPETYELNAESVVSVSDQDEFIRNVDLVSNLIEDVLEATGIKEKIAEPMKRMKKFVEKLFK